MFQASRHGLPEPVDPNRQPLTLRPPEREAWLSAEEGLPLPKPDPAAEPQPGRLRTPEEARARWSCPAEPPPGREPVSSRARRRMPRLRWVIRHPLDVLERSGFGPIQTTLILLFSTVIAGSVTYVFFVRLS